MKNSLPVLLGALSAFVAGAQPSKFDSTAILILDRMTDVIGGLESCSFKVTAANDVAAPAKEVVKYFSDYEVFMGGPDKMLVNAHGHKGHRQFLYNGQRLAYYSFDERNYGIIPTPNTVIKMIDSLHAVYDMDFPAADFFYPSFTDDLLEHSDSIRFLGTERIGAKEYFHIIAFAKEEDVQFWISSDAYNLPARFSIAYKAKEGTPQYLALFSDWNINPHLPAAMFDFTPPPGATQLRILSKKDL